MTDRSAFAASIPWARERVQAPTGREAADFDRRATEGRGVSEPALIERAGSQAATWIHTHLSHLRASPVLILAGSGHNGADALVAARCLSLWGWAVRIVHTGSRPSDRALLHGHGLRAGEAGDLADVELDGLVSECGLTVDGMLGTGVRGAPRGQVPRIIQRMQQGCGTVVSLDLPSGVDADTGRSSASVRADVTLAFGWPKLGTLLHPGRARSGRIVALEIGFPPVDVPFRYTLLTTGEVAPHLPRRDPVTHKNQVGSLCLVAGSSGMAGAAILAGRAALRTGAGYLRVASVAENRAAVQAALPEAVWVDRDDPDALRDALEASSAVAVGPGIGLDAPARQALGTVLTGLSRPTVLDADALTLLADGDDLVPRDRALVVTPHPGEAARLLGIAASEVEADRPAALDRLREATGAVVLLKGTPSLVAGDRRWLDPHGSSDLAAAGMGDVLTGVVGSLLAQSVPPENAAGLALVVTGLAARRARMGAGLQSADLPDHLPAVMASESGEPELPAAPPPGLPWVTFDLEPAR